MNVILPNIDETITNDRAIELCKHFSYTHLVKRIEGSRDKYKNWVFDGASMVPDQIFAKLFHIPNLVEIALKHDLKYAYGEQGNDIEKLRADLEFELDVLNDGASPRMAKLMFAAVDLGGNEKLNTPYSWAYAHI
ncbi:hypothetical protein [methanotrophic endosymbiont of Bathymodiolus puteoserpentis (Logatchev)]|jgi:hypothetical protein|uniref:hypothetical protein n=1 Tax=methanotrophic endosymbiont of Bathymodiolus puteoserpentis (Logatchev) TaxID=343235 RepID=UPI0013CB1555|nr:hypothetical protein [methanotrophic endosymbiont of Bathymodiolus puteoserpentis (Logatchev)]SHE22485.1 hypothetical protein BPUTEOMOX_2002 [methanotrophic endosymbiont of Bathymodiolus puteoserpentis (Logatchev)]